MDLIIFFGNLEGSRSLRRFTCLRYHGRWIDSVWKSRSYAGALRDNPINLPNVCKLNILDYVSFRSCTKPLRNVDHLTLDVPFSRTDVFKNSFFVRICHLWNDLPLGIRESYTLSIFRKNLIAFYYDKFNVNFF